MKMFLTECLEFVGTTVQEFEGEKRYISTGALDKDHVNEADVELVTYENRPSRANLQAVAGDILFAKMANTEKTFMVDSISAEDIYSTGFCAVRANDKKILRKCLFYFLSSSLFLEQKDKNSSGATQKAITNSGLAQITITLPSLEEQQKFVGQMDLLNDAITARTRQLAMLDDLVKSRFIELFGMPGTDAFGWGLVPLGSICNINPKKSLDSRLVSGAVVSFVPMPAVTEHGEIDATAIKEYDEVKTGFTYFAENDVLFAKITPCMENGKGAVAKGLHNGIGFGSTEFHVLRPISGKSDPYWIYTLTAFSQFRMDAASNMTGSAGQRRVPASFLENYRVSLPPIALQEQFAAFVEQTDKSKLAVKQSLEKLETLKKSLMQQYFG